MSKFQNNPPSQRRYLNSSGMVTNACPNNGEATNGMDFDKPEVEEYFEEKNRNRWEHDPTSAVRSIKEEKPEQDIEAMMAESRRNYERDVRVENSRFLHKPSTGQMAE